MRLEFCSLQLCDNATDIDSEGLLCNNGNKKKLGYLNSGAVYDLRVRVKYDYNISVEGVWSERYGKIVISNITIENTTEIISSTIQFSNFTELIDLLNSKQKAIDSLVEIPATPLITNVCPPNYCKNSGKCIILGTRHRCKCLSNSYGLTCSISSEYRSAIKSNDYAASTLHLLINTANASQVIEALSIITSNSDLVSDNAIAYICDMVSTSIDNASLSSNDVDALEQVVWQTLSSLMKNLHNS